MQLDPFRGETLATTLRLRKDDQRVVRIAQHARIGTAQADATRSLPPGSNRHLRHRFARNRDSRWVATSVEARRTACTSCGRSSLRPRRPPSPTSCAHTSRSPICLRTEAAPQDEGRGSYRRGLAACAAPALAPALTRRVIQRKRLASPRPSISARRVPSRARSIEDLDGPGSRGRSSDSSERPHPNLVMEAFMLGP